jgi:thiol-disulfide isomerase/thioredoxin
MGLLPTFLPVPAPLLSRALALQSRDRQGAVPPASPKPPIIREVRRAAAEGRFEDAARLLRAYRAASGPDAYWAEASSWLARGFLAARDYQQAAEAAAATRRAALDLLKTRKLDDEPSLPIALGAAIEVEGQRLDALGQKSEAVAFLQEELARWRDTSIRTRIQKNIHLISLVGKPAPAIDTREFLGPKPPSLAERKGRPVLLMFWAHWCGDCKANAEAVARVAREFRPSGLLVLGPTQPYGYVAGGEEAPREKELPYIDQVRTRFYASIEGFTVPVSEENFRHWGASTTPTFALIDRQGVVRLYHPGNMTYEELATALRK